jgi:hypothetical protein
VTKGGCPGPARREKGGDFVKLVLIWSVVVLGGAVILAGILFLGLGPGLIAKRRGHPSMEAIRILGVIGLLIWPCWIVALVWAYTGKANPLPADEPDYHLGTRRAAAATPEDRAFQARSRRERKTTGHERNVP